MKDHTTRIAVVQPAAYSGPREAENVDRAIAYLGEAADAGAQIVCFPELYPGPANPVNEFDADVLYQEARKRRVYVIRGRREEASDGAFYVAAEMIGPDGTSLGSYRRTTPAGPYIYRDIDVWNFDYQAGNQLPIFETPHGVVGLLVCSEVYVPELARALAHKGAEILFCPAGGLINELMPTWQIMIQARAIENLMFVGASQNLYGVEEGLGMIAGPESVIAQLSVPGIMIGDLDMARQRWLRQEQEKIEMPKQYRVVPGTLSWKDQIDSVQ
ncbi:MAG TPA: carbon-nitrogen hydrolase family protein [Alkalispirochaeta sp.]|nr:carbon-nitrogen hydrolase family protein [Alkalispirochaeta sp.]